jgi:hypothetical protein
MGAPPLDGREEPCVEPPGCGLLNANDDVQAMSAEEGDAGAVHERIRVGHCENDPANTGCENSRRARACPPGVAARLERAVQGSGARPISCVGQRQHFGVRPSREGMPSPADDYAFVVHDYRSDHRVRAGRTPAPLGERERHGHVAGV